MPNRIGSTAPVALRGYAVLDAATRRPKLLQVRRAAKTTLSTPPLRVGRGVVAAGARIGIVSTESRIHEFTSEAPVGFRLVPTALAILTLVGAAIGVDGA